MKNKKGNVAIIAIIIVIVAITAGVVGYLFAKKTQAPVAAPVVPTVVQPVAQTPAISQQPADETVNWQTYTNAELGFSFKYPNSWPVPVLDKSAHASDGGYPGQDSVWTLNIGNQEKVCEGELCYVFKFEGYNRNNYQLFSNDLKKDELIKVKSETNINGSNSIVYAAGGMCVYKNAFVFGNNLSVKFSAHCGEDDVNISKVFDQILSTFKFTK